MDNLDMFFLFFFFFTALPKYQIKTQYRQILKVKREARKCDRDIPVDYWLW